MSNQPSILPIYTKSLPPLDGSVSAFFRKAASSISIPDCGGRPTPPVLRKTLAAIYHELNILDDILDQSRPFEKAGKLQAERRLYLQRTAIHFQMALDGYPEMIDLSFLGKYSGDPDFGVTTTTHRSGGMLIKCYKEHQHDSVKTLIEPELPADIAAYYQPVVDTLSKDFTGNKIGESFYYCEPSGFMPPDLKKRLKVSEKPGMFAHFFVVFAATWKKNKKITEDRDPLIIARHHSKFGPFDFLIGMYDPTPLEEYMAMNYTTSPHYTK